MELKSRGYVFTLITALMSMLIMSLILFYGQLTSPSYEDETGKMSLEELHYFIESLREDASRAMAISAHRSTAYAIDHIIVTNETFEDYNMRQCHGFNYSDTGVEAAIAELMVCGTLANTENPADNIEDYMQNNTLKAWIASVENTSQGMPYNVSVTFSDMKIALYDPWHYVIVTEYDIYAEDTSNSNTYWGESVPVTSVVDVTTLEDPIYHYIYGIPAALKTFKKCEVPFKVNASVVDEWVDTGCYIAADEDENSPSIFDRMNANTHLDPEFEEKSQKLMEELGYRHQPIGFESFVNINLLKEYNISVNNNLSQVDYHYFSGAESNCRIEGMKKHPDFRLTIDKATKYGVTGLDCVVEVTHSDNTDEFTPAYMEVPVNTTITWTEKAGIKHSLISIPNAWDGELILQPNSILRWKFNESGQYNVLPVDYDGAYTILVQ